MKKAVSVLLTIILLFSIAAFPISAANVTDEDITFYKTNIQIIKDYVIEHGADYNPTYFGRGYRYIEKTKTENKVAETARILYYSDSDEIVFEFSSTVLVPGIIDSSSVTFYNISFEKQSYIEYYQLLGKYGTKAHSESFDLIDFDYNKINKMYFEYVNDSSSQNTSQQLLQEQANFFYELLYTALGRWNELLNELFGFTLYGIGLATSTHNHSLNKSGTCKECGRQLIDISNCSCTCHKNDFFSNFLTSFKMIFWKLFRIKQTCDCGMRHY